MFNLTVADIHTYHVVIGDDAVLVHNCGPGRAIGPGSGVNPNVKLGLKDLLKPAGQWIGDKSKNVRTLRGSVDDARRLFDVLAEGGKVIHKAPTRITVKIEGGHLTFRTNSDSGTPAIDVNIPGLKQK